MKAPTALLLCVSLCLSGCSIAVEVRDGNFSFSFESGFDNWAVRILDEGPGGSIGSTVLISTQEARDGASSLRFELDSRSGDGKLWIERNFRFDDNRRRRVTVTFSFASADLGTVGNFRMLAGARRQRPETRGDLMPLAQEDTGNGANTLVGYRWMEKSYTTTIDPFPTGGGSGSQVQSELWVVVGIWGAVNARRSYFVDNVRVMIEGV